MPKRAVLTVGLGFGDEGKGATVDYLTRKYNADLVVRYSGGCQAGHNVQLPDGRRHTFSQFGAGTLAGANTYLSRHFLFDPPALFREAAHLVELGVQNPLHRIAIHPDALVVTPYHRALNRLKEIAREAATDVRHGSCGRGIGETRRYALKYGSDAIFVRDLYEPAAKLRQKLSLLRDRTRVTIQKVFNPPRHVASSVWAENAMGEALLPPETVTEAIRPPDNWGSVTEAPRFSFAIFEGAQGILLDEAVGFHPHTTWSDVTLRPAMELASEFGVEKFSTMGILRCYATRHGEGPFPTEDNSLRAILEDPGNPFNMWQQHMRFGHLDMALTRYAVECAVQSMRNVWAEASGFDSLVVNHLDQADAIAKTGAFKVALDERGTLNHLQTIPSLKQQAVAAAALRRRKPAYKEISPGNLLQRLWQFAPVRITGHGPTHVDRREGTGLPFRDL